ncbi:MAG: hypothetical protein IPL27_09560 [Lewinellaceae bacterium]|nr:hypothetical protein [Lewinellaceae bacterium]
MLRWPCPSALEVQGCVASQLLWNGNIIMASGTDQEVYGPGTRKMKQYNVFTKTWQILPLMLDYRWYPSMTQLADGRLLITGGGGLNNPVRVNTTELYDPLTGQTEWVDTIAIRNEQSPILTLYSGKALMTFRPPQLFDPVTEQWDLAADFVQGNRMSNGDHVDHELVHLPEGEVIAIGFKPFPAGSGGNLGQRGPHQPCAREPMGLHGLGRPIRPLYRYLAAARGHAAQTGVSRISHLSA